MIERCEDFRLALESCEPFRIRSHGFGEHLDGDGPFQVGVRRPIHLPHAAFADLARDFIRAEASAGSEGQTGVDYTRAAATMRRLLLSDADVLGTRVPREVGICAELLSSCLEPTETDAAMVPTDERLGSP